MPTTDQPAKRELWLRRFTQLYAEAFTRRWPTDAIRDVWWPILDAFEPEEVELALQILQNDRAEPYPPQPAAWRALLQDARRRLASEAERRAPRPVVQRGIHQADLDRLSVINRQLGLPPPEFDDLVIPDAGGSA